MNYIYTICFLFVFQYGIAEEKGINFIDYKKTSFDKVLLKARKEHKVIFVDAWTVWCGPCKLLKKDVLSRKDVGEYFNAHFINLQFDAEDPAWVEIAEKYFITAFPTLLFISSDGSLLHTASNLQISMFANDGTPIAVNSLLSQGASVLNITQMSTKQFVSDENWEFFKNYGDMPYTLIFRRIIENRVLFLSKYGAEVDRIISSRLNRMSVNLFRKSSKGWILNQGKYDFFKNIVNSANLPNKEEMLFFAELEIEASKQKWGQIEKMTSEKIARGVLSDFCIEAAARKIILSKSKGFSLAASVWMENIIKRSHNNEVKRSYYQVYISLLEEAGETEKAMLAKEELKRIVI